MSQTLVGIVYDKRTLALRRIIVPDDDAALGTAHKPSQNEELIRHPRHKGWGLDAAIDAIRLHSGREPPTLEMIHAQGL